MVLDAVSVRSWFFGKSKQPRRRLSRVKRVERNTMQIIRILTWPYPHLVEFPRTLCTILELRISTDFGRVLPAAGESNE